MSLSRAPARGASAAAIVFDVALAVACISAVPLLVPLLTPLAPVKAAGAALVARFPGLSFSPPPVGDPKTWWFLAPEHVRFAHGARARGGLSLAASLCARAHPPPSRRAPLCPRASTSPSGSCFTP